MVNAGWMGHTCIDRADAILQVRQEGRETLPAIRESGSGVVLEPQLACIRERK